MFRGNLRSSGWQGAYLVAITYVYFLIFAQFAFLARLTALGIVGPHLKAVMAAMAAGGILLSLLTPRVKSWPSPSLRLTVGLTASATAAFSSLLPLNLPASVAIAFLIGAGLGLTSVTLVTHLQRWTGDRNPLLQVGVGTGIGYLLCNVPSFFAANPQVQAALAGFLCLAGVAIVPFVATEQPAKLKVHDSQPVLPFVLIVASFAALVWLDSAAFFIIQNTAILKAGMWQGSALLWANGFLHLGAALCSAWLLRRRGLSFVLASAFFALAFACLLLLDPTRSYTASVFYPIGVSLYSVALVAYPALLSSASSIEERGRQGGWIYACAGWIGSALGIGMGQNLGHVPVVFVAIAGAVILLPLFKNLLTKFLPRRVRELALVALVLLIALAVDRLQPSAPVAASLTPVERGRLVYISEGCINCHSQYVRPNTADVLMWGPVQSLDELHQERPPLIGNRRQGPDLSQVGGRRSPLWLKMHLFNPREVSGSSVMPSYAFLFRNQRGNDLVAYLASLHGPGTEQHISDEQNWHLPADAISEADISEGQQLYSQYCATCHSADGRTRNAWQSEFVESPAILTSAASAGTQSVNPSSSRTDHLAQIIKFGIPNSDMAGHEYFSDKNIASISLWLSRNTAQPVRNP
jgi:cbb3-type cytochrome c oxidase subunit II